MHRPPHGGDHCVIHKEPNDGSTTNDSRGGARATGRPFHSPGTQHERSLIHTVARAVIAEQQEWQRTDDDPVLRDVYAQETTRLRTAFATLGIHVEPEVVA
jgi:hypothetical protein